MRSSQASKPLKLWHMCKVKCQKKSVAKLGARDMGRRLNGFHIISFEFCCYPMCGCRTWKHPTEARSCVALNLIWAETAKTKTVWEKQMATFNSIWQHMTMSLKISDNTFGWFQWSLIGWLCQVSGMKTRNDVCQLYCKLSIFSQAQVSSHASGSGALMQLHWVARDYILWFMELGEQKSFISVNLDIRSRDHLVIQLFQL